MTTLKQNFTLEEAFMAAQEWHDKGRDLSYYEWRVSVAGLIAPLGPEETTAFWEAYEGFVAKLNEQDHYLAWDETEDTAAARQRQHWSYYRGDGSAEDWRRHLDECAEMEYDEEAAQREHEEDQRHWARQEEEDAYERRVAARGYDSEPSSPRSDDGFGW